MYKNRRGCVISRFVCSDCGTIIPLPRNHGRMRKKGHIKDLYCPVCKVVKKCEEIMYKDYYRNIDGDIIYK